MRPPPPVEEEDDDDNDQDFISDGWPFPRGVLDLSFGTEGKVTTPVGTGGDFAFAIALQSDGKIVVAGASFNGANADFTVVRYTTNGSLDKSFDGDGIALTPIGPGDDVANAVAIQPDGKIVVAGGSFNGTDIDFALVRYNSNGTLDTSFDGDGIALTPIGPVDEIANAVAIQPDDKIVAAGGSFSGTDVDFALVRYNPNGSLDDSFDVDGIVTTSFGAMTGDEATSLALQPDGMIVAAGFSLSATSDFALARYNTNGSLDAAFDTDGMVVTPIGVGDDQAFAIVIQSNGRIVVAGSAQVGADLQFALVRYNANGSLDTSFDEDGKVLTAVAGNSEAHGLALQSNGRIVAAGVAANATDDFAVVRYRVDGSLDGSFGTAGIVTTDILGNHDVAFGVAIQSNNRIVVAGVTFNGANEDIAVVRYR